MVDKKNVELKNADVNFNQYGDDSSAPNQATAWWMNEKYVGENTKNSNIAYNNSIKTADLDPEYVYGWDAQVANSNDAGYIARRNDNIASALYNEGKRSKEDVIQFLWSQKNWNNSTEADRFNTVESVWKRIWDIQENNDKDETELEVKADEEVKKEEPKGKNVDVNTFLQGSTTELFGKMITWADTAPYDHNSNEWKKAEARLKQYERVNALSVPQLASSIKAWSILSGGQAMRDLQTYNPEKYQQLQEYQKKEETLDQINMISSGNVKDSETDLQDKTADSINNYLNETVANAWGDALSRMDLDTALSQNQGLVNYAERMSYYQSKINQLDQTIWDLEEDARRRLSKTTGENVPEYMIQNYVNNRSKKLYKQRDNLLNQYNYYKWVYEAQVEQEAQEWERDYKERQLKLQENKALWDQSMDVNKLNYDYDKLYSDGITGTWAGGMRTERHNNPTAMITSAVAKLGGVEWVDYERWDPFIGKDGRTYYTARLIWDPIEKTIELFDRGIEKWSMKNIFSMWSYGNKLGLTNEKWKNMDSEQKRDTVLRMLKEEWGDISKMTYYNSWNSSELYKQLKNGTITYANYIKKAWNDMSQEEKDQWIIQNAVKDAKSWKDLQDTFNWLRKVSAKSFYTWEMAKNTRYEMLNALSESERSNKEIMKMVDDRFTEMGSEDEDLAKALAMALAWRYTDFNALNNELKEINRKASGRSKFRSNTIPEQIWDYWEENGIV